jgi:hypothetical protein
VPPSNKNFISNTLFLGTIPKLTFIKLDELDTSIDERSGLPNTPQHYDWLLQAAEWAENKWGYMRGFPGIEKRIELILAKQKTFYLALYIDQDKQSHLIGTFSLTPNDMDVEAEATFQKNKTYYVKPLPNNKSTTLSYFYIHDNFREFGFGSQMLEMAKELSKAAEMTMVAHVLTSNLYGFYKKRGAEFVAEDRALKEPCELIHFGKRSP